MQHEIAEGVVHTLPADLLQRLRSDAATLQLWQGLTALGRNEWICWVEDAKNRRRGCVAWSVCRKTCTRASAGRVAGRGASIAERLGGM